MVILAGSTGYAAGFTIYRYDTVYLFYNTAGVVVKDSVRSAGRDQVHNRTLVSTCTKINDALYRIDGKTTTENGVTVPGRWLSGPSFYTGSGRSEYYT